MRLSIFAAVATVAFALPTRVERDGDILSNLFGDLPIAGDLLSPSSSAKRADSGNPLSIVSDITNSLPIDSQNFPLKRSDPFSEIVSKVLNQTAKRDELPGLDLVGKVLNDTMGALPTKRQDEISSLIGNVIDQVTGGTSSRKRSESDLLAPVEQLLGPLLGGGSKREIDTSTVQQLAGQIENAFNLSEDQKNAVNGALSQFTTSLSKRADISVEDLAKQAISFITKGESKRDAGNIIDSTITKVEDTVEQALSGSA
ncbi:hypothetical protein E3Q23_02751 [Wallemia mellicola]|uniref:Uncharacterized protein n=1 Tax=Wallemia mellicola TaxID=1708541 RepID=A0A4T0SQC5_9BASI|nr:hypothetical protein E3Q23_02751 [Wallemia mellicola]TIC53518.1 hypothetical protein E3Q05_02412 [Wallemia mellicola]TIC64179.1 hypothetical protein E3Q01_02957 [Wallemia mellicola]